MAKNPNTTTQSKGFPGDPDYVESPIVETERKFLALVDDPGQVVDPRTVQVSIMQRILGADDFDAALDMADQGALATADLAGYPFRVLGVSWHRAAPANAENSVGVFALLTVEVLDGPLTGQTVALTTGAANVLAALYKGLESGALPSTERTFTFKPVNTATGYTAYWLAKAETRATASR